jgi:hypothetical protein
VLSHKISEKTNNLSAFAKAIHTMHNKSKEMEAETPQLSTVKDARIPSCVLLRSFLQDKSVKLTSCLVSYINKVQILCMEQCEICFGY